MSSDRRARIRSEAGRLFSEQGVSATTVRQIGDEVGLLSGSLYYYFPSKESIAAEIIVQYLEELTLKYQQLTSSGQSARDRIQNLVLISLKVAADYPYATEIYQNEFSTLHLLPDYDRIEAMVTSAHETWDAIILQGVADGEFRSDVDPVQVHRMLRELVWLEVRWNRAVLADTYAAIARRLITIFLDGFSTGANAPDAGSPELSKLTREVEALKSSVAELRATPSP